MRVPRALGPSMPSCPVNERHAADLLRVENADVRYVVFGAGAIGGTIAARLQMAGFDVVAIARGDHLRALQTGGLRFVTPEEETTLRIAVHESAAAARVRDDDVVIV